MDEVLEIWEDICAFIIKEMINELVNDLLSVF